MAQAIETGTEARQELDRLGLNAAPPHKRELKRKHGVVGYLSGHNVQAEGEGEREAQDGGGTDHRVQPHSDSDRDTPGQTLGCRSHAKQRKDGEHKTAVKPAVVRRLWGVGGHSSSP